MYSYLNTNLLHLPCSLLPAPSLHQPNFCTNLFIFCPLSFIIISISTRSMQGMFGASVSELYLLDKLLINIEDSRSMCDHKKKYTCIHRDCESGLAIIYKHAAHKLVQHTLH